MNCSQAIEYIHSLERFGIKPGLGRIGELCAALGNPQNACRFIHVAGTNGKGSTSTLIAGVLTRCGFVTGLYTSPYVVDFRERICLNGEMIEPKDLAKAVEKVKLASEQNAITVTEFEAVTAAAFVYYSAKKCDFVVLETGLGGRFDATNIIPAPAVSVITSISYDHMDILGNTIEAIAGEKCGIIKQGSKVVTYPFQDEAALSVIKDTCSLKNVPLIIPDAGKAEILSSDFAGSKVKYDGFIYSLALPGEHMVYNSLMAVEALRALDAGITDEMISSSFAVTRMPARTEVIPGNPCVIIDGGHNDDCARALEKYIKAYLSGKRIIAVSSLMADKDYEAYVSRIAPLTDCFITTTASNPRALPCGKLLETVSKYTENRLSCESPRDAVEKALSLAGEDDIVLICGSFYLAGDVRKMITGDEEK